MQTFTKSSQLGRSKSSCFVSDIRSMAGLLVWRSSGAASCAQGACATLAFSIDHVFVCAQWQARSQVNSRCLPVEGNRLGS